MKKAIISVFLALLAVSMPARATVEDDSALVASLNGARVVAQDKDKTFLGNIAGRHDSDSIFNPQGTFGNEYSAESIWNGQGTFRSEHNPFSPFNRRSTTPPKIIKGGNIIGYLTTNPSIQGGVSPHWLKTVRHRF